MAETTAGSGDGRAAFVSAGATRALRIAIAGLFLIYVSPLLALVFSFLFTSRHFTNSDTILAVFAGFAITSDASFSLVHRALLPLMAGMAPIAFKDDDSSNWTIGLMLALLAAIALSILLSAAFHNPDYMRGFMSGSLFGLSEVADEPDPQKFAERAIIIMQPVYSFFSRTQEVMSMYLLMLFGLTLSKTA